MADWPYTWPWPVIRLQVLERDGYECQIRDEGCTGRATEADHIQSWREGGAPFDLANLRAACKPCNSARGGRRAQALARANRTRASGPSRDW